MFYYVNLSEESEKGMEIHSRECSWLAGEDDREFLGDFTSCHGALKEAKKRYGNCHPCPHCC